jgi:hypothetical protein
MKLSLRTNLIIPCSRCGEDMDFGTLDDRRIEVALFGRAPQTCPVCLSTQGERDGRPLPPEDPI